MSTPSSPPPKCNKDALKNLQKKCWREEYIRILERFEYPPPFRPPLPEHQTPLEKEVFHALLNDLEDAGLISSSQVIGVSIPGCITYSGRLELERLKSERPWRKCWKYAIAGVAFALGALFNALLEIIQPFLHSWLFGAQ